MEHSETLGALASALSSAQAEIENADKNAKNPHFKSTYADLAEIINTTRPVLTKHGLAVVQIPGFYDGVVTVETMLTHKSGEWIKGTSGAPAQKLDPQGVGSAITYLRRYSLAAICNIAQEDDDAESAVSRKSDAHVVANASSRIVTPPDPRHDASDVPTCPKCDGKMFDNRKDKRNPKAPDFKCRDKDKCDGALWAKREKPVPATVGAQTSYDDPPESFGFPELVDSSLPF